MTTGIDLFVHQGKSVLVTGGASGLGLACARAIAEAGTFVALADIQEVGQNFNKRLHKR
jgi:NAD(P)-dependent dehydrogenase (short-subunit alcohol dehydrogenase family)